MNRTAIILFMSIAGFPCLAQSHQADILRWQHHYKAEFVAEERSPVKAKDTGYIRFYPVSSKWAVSAEVVLTPAAESFDMATHSGKTKRFRQYALLKFTDPRSRRKMLTLSAYERIDRPASDTQAAAGLFIPFQDLTNGGETDGGGRYIDVKKADIRDGRLLLDFNKAYNPYCAFAEGFSCPIPPAENRLNISVRAGEKLPDPPLRIRE
jgi:uncharacterized protein (DUF1684 family)